jgi:wobble nucleotide-excising tRNase
VIKSLKRIPSLAVFKGFEWDTHVVGEDGHPRYFKKLNIIYGRNYSGKTSLSRILRALETKVISDKYISPEFTIELEDGSFITNTDFQHNTQTIRVFNEDFIKENLKFIADPTEELNSFAVIGESNVEIEEKIKPLELELGIETKSEETGLYAKLALASSDYTEKLIAYNTANNSLTNQLSKKATDAKIGIKYKSDVFGDKNYTKPKLEADIIKVLKPNYVPIDETEKSKLETLIREKQLNTIPSIQTPTFAFDSIKATVSELVERKVGQSDKIESLLKDAVLNKWVQEGVHLHKDKHLQSCSFCGNDIFSSRWSALEKHFDEESKGLETDIDLALQAIQTEQTKVANSMRIQPSLFYVTFHSQLNQLSVDFNKSIEEYTQALDNLKIQLAGRKKDILNSKIYSDTEFSMDNMNAAFQEYEAIRVQSNKFTDNLSTSKKQAQEKLRLKEVFDFAATIDYSNQLITIESLKTAMDSSNQTRLAIQGEINSKKSEIQQLKNAQKDEANGAQLVNNHLQSFFGNQFLSLQPKTVGGHEPQIYFEVIRDGTKAYHLSEGECSLLAFCYFLAKLDDTNTKNKKPTIWIDDPISSLDSNHVFFVYSMINSEIVMSAKFEQLFISTHNLDFLKYLKRLKGANQPHETKEQNRTCQHFLLERTDKVSTLKLMPRYLKDYVTEFNYLFEQIYKCANLQNIDQSNYMLFYNFGNNARKFLEIYLYYKYPNHESETEKQNRFFEGKLPSLFVDRINNEYSHIAGIFERGQTPVEVPEMQQSAKLILDRIKATDLEQYNSLLISIGVQV